MCGYCDDKLGYLNARGIFSQLGINDRLINRALTMQLVTLLPSSDHPKEIPVSSGSHEFLAYLIRPFVEEPNTILSRSNVKCHFLSRHLFSMKCSIQAFQLNFNGYTT